MAAGDPATVYLADAGKGWPDALAAAAAAGRRDGDVVLLAAEGHAPQAAVEFVADGDVGEVVAVGGRLDPATVAEIAGDVPTRRVAGATRFVTAAELAGRVVREHGGAFGQPAWLAGLPPGGAAESLVGRLMSVRLRL